MPSSIRLTTQGESRVGEHVHKDTLDIGHSVGVTHTRLKFPEVDTNDIVEGAVPVGVVLDK